MDKQDAVDFIVDQFEQGSSPVEIAHSLSKQLNASYEVVLRFTSRTLEQRMALTEPAPSAQSGYSDPSFSTSGSEDFDRSPAGPIATGEINPRLEKFILDALGRDQTRSDIILAVCERAGLDWTNAQLLVDQVEVRNRKKITSRRNVILIPLSILAILAGIGLTAAALSDLSAHLTIPGTTLGSDEQIITGALETYFSLRYLIFYILPGIGLLVGGAYGLFLALRSQFE